MAETLNAVQLKSLLLYVGDKVIDAKEILSEADRNIGDGDHGIGMAKGFDAVRSELGSKDFDDAYAVFSTAGRTMIRVMGGASGIIFGLLFFAGSKGMPPKPDLTTAEFAEIFAKALAEIQARGGAKPGDKTLVDGLTPAVEEMQKAAAQDAGYKSVIAAALAGAEAGKENSKGYIAGFGKAKTLGERALGYPDAGCVTLTVIFSAMHEWANQNL
jgi:dihydroxyacetone kinase phosphoprotein-dependent L subunit